MRRLFLALAVVVSAGCYRATVDTGATPSSTVVTKPWTMTYFYGLIPAKPLETAALCPQGVAKVETHHSFLNLLVGAFVGIVVQPITITVTCAQ